MANEDIRKTDNIELPDFMVQETMEEVKETEQKTVAKYTDDFVIPTHELTPALEAILFVSGEPVSLSKLVDLLGIDSDTVTDSMNKLISQYENNPWGGLLIRKVEDSYVMCTKPSMKNVMQRFFSPRMRPPLSQASYETLAIIAYNQPVTRAQVEAVRGVSSDSIISRLLDRGWICEAGTLDAPGRPTLFETTEQFLLEFGINSVKDLPSMELMSYQTIRDLEVNLEKASGNSDGQLTIDSLIENANNENDENEDE
ncbi:MAG: SMC-Scp complex subunit ScpB [Clostridia bacterium]|nr:SMC-Scp complex subunit ScpB [Clostridia bacterium]